MTWWLLLSTDSLSWYGLDLVFQTAKQVGFDGLDLALWKNFDAWNVSYVQQLCQKYELPIKVIQLSPNVNQKELSHAAELAKTVGAEVISINPPSIFNVTSYNFLKNSLPSYKKHFTNIKFSIINPEKSSLFMLPVPKFYFSNVADIIKEFKCYLALDISNLEEQVLEVTFLKKLSNYAQYISTLYISDKSKNWDAHLTLGDWVLKLPTIFKKFKQTDYKWYFSLKISISKKDLSDLDKVEQILKKNKNYFKENFTDLVVK